MSTQYYVPDFVEHQAWTMGFWNIGPVHIPPIPPVAGMTDRAGTGEIWYLFWDGESHLLLTNTLPAVCQDIYIFQPYDGPYLGSTGWRMGVTTASQPATPNSPATPAGEPHLVIDFPDSNGGVAASGQGYTSSARPMTVPNYFAPLQWRVPESTGWPAPQPGTIPGIPSTAPPATGGGYAAFLAAFATNVPVLVSSTYVAPSVNVPQPWHLLHYGP